ncbi:biotin/lipoate A/B protein ligase [Natronococcus amylolyticus DSM 10524]|uniref:Biotin/lipoate A/B protein ligase n=1 Tax=Natronococcus amylolyticus DSM 10524 TaxID=1227497 RepID=L9XGQ8_9EURY|nr:lipoate--protein ligase family protein [Natronococcus amylolyticus]ELY59868.1 biotin/lipoate A/B protein ligase [Natronococcus amylolyticus DSM 10524]
MRVFRGRAGTIEADREASERLLEVAADGEPAVRVWTPHRQVAFGRRDSRLEGYERAREAARERAFPPIERSVGGRAVAYDGETTLAFARAEPIEDFRRGTDERYERLTADVARSLEKMDVGLERGEPDDSFCPGAHSLSTADAAGLRKVVGIAQRVRQDAALVSGILVVDGREELARVLEAVYGALGVPFDPDSVGSIARASGEDDPTTIARAIEDGLVGDRDPAIVEVGK